MKADKFGLTDSFTTWSRNYGSETSMYNGVQLNVTARMRSGLTVQGGVNSGKTVTDNCEVQAELPEISPTNPYCHSDPGFVTRLTGLASYTVPKVDVLVSGTFRSDQGTSLAANYIVTNTVAGPSLGRPLSAPGNTVTVNLIEPGTEWGDRINNVDLRIAKVLRFGRARTNVGMDIYNVFNSSAVLNYNPAFNPGGTWLTPTSVVAPRFARFNMSVEF